jgi:hypothetical protein
MDTRVMHIRFHLKADRGKRILMVLAYVGRQYETVKRWEHEDDISIKPRGAECIQFHTYRPNSPLGLC